MANLNIYKKDKTNVYHVYKFTILYKIYGFTNLNIAPDSLGVGGVVAAAQGASVVADGVAVVAGASSSSSSLSSYYRHHHHL